jgi:hypothetical protein
LDELRAIVTAWHNSSTMPTRRQSQLRLLKRERVHEAFQVDQSRPR